MTAVYHRERLHGILTITCTSLVLSLFAAIPVARAQGFPDGSRVLALVRPDDSTVSSTISSGMVCASGSFGKLVVQKKGEHQSFVLNAYGLSLTPDGGYGLFIGSSPDVTGAVFINVLSNLGTNGHWQLVLDSTNGAPAELRARLGVGDVNELVGLFAFVADGGTNVALQNVALQTLVTPLVPKLSTLNFRKTVRMTRPDPAPSIHATGTIRVKYNGATGASLLDVRARHLAKGNIYCAYFVVAPGDSAPTCESGDYLSTGNGFITYDTGKGEDLPYGLPLGVNTVTNLSGLFVEIRDAFGATHLSGKIP